MSTKSVTKSKGFSADEKAAMKERAKELKAQTNKADWEKDLLAKIAEMPPHDRDMARKFHAIVTANAPHLTPKTWYGMPAYTNKEGKVICFFQAAAKFDARYATFGFNDDAMLDDGHMWATSYALMEVTAAEEARIAALVKKAAS